MAAAERFSGRARIELLEKGTDSMSASGDSFDHGAPQSVARAADECSFARLLDLRTEKVERGHALASLRVSSEKHLNKYGYTHGAALFAVADHAGSVCGNTLGRKAVMIQSNMSFFNNPSVGSTVLAEARVTHEGKRTGGLEVDLTTEDGVYLAHFTAVIYFFS